MASYKLPPIERVPLLSDSARADLLDCLFEPSESLHTICNDLLRRRSFDSYHTLIWNIRHKLESLLKTSSESDLLLLDETLGSHPRLGEKTIKSTQSQAEQAQLASHDDNETLRLAEMNALYEKTFPGLRYVVFVNGRPRSVILEDMQSRIDRGDIVTERAEAIIAMCEIASDRAHKQGRDAMTTEATTGTSVPNPQ